MSEPSLNPTSSAGCLIGSRESVDLELGFIKLESIYSGSFTCQAQIVISGDRSGGKKKNLLEFYSELRLLICEKVK